MPSPFANSALLGTQQKAVESNLSNKEMRNATKRWNRTDRRKPRNRKRKRHGTRAGTRPNGRLRYGPWRQLRVFTMRKDRASPAGGALLAGEMSRVRSNDDQIAVDP